MNNKIKKLTLIILLTIVLVGTMFLSVGGNFNSLLCFVDIPSFIVILLPVVVMLIFTDLMVDYIRAVKFVWSKNEHTINELKASVEAVNLSIKLVSTMGIVGTMIALVVIFTKHTPIDEYFFTYLSVGILTILYALIFNLVQLPIRYALLKEIIYKENK